MKHLVNLDDELLEQARTCLGTTTIKDTVNEALRLASDAKRRQLDEALDDLAFLSAELPIRDRSDGW
ncbi:MAG TPA: type II toxin-antitoxin system VapB family antitoxin [Chloroflexota bacterium]|nr:type II toxin-antitoxin system VapB family antitoxin [Chloroflexota bacterium]